jgi:hypothetical protein
MKRLSVVVVVAFALVAAGCGSSSSTPTSPAASGNPVFSAALSPANEVPPVTNGEAGVTGTANITLNVTKDASGNITSASATMAATLGGFPAGSSINIAHIHEGAVTCVCPVVVNTNIAPGDVTITNGLASFTKTTAITDVTIAQRIIANPGGFYFNVHTVANPSGAARGVLKAQ